VPLLERLRFLTIVSGNLDEFFEVRVAELRESAFDRRCRGGRARASGSSRSARGAGRRASTALLNDLLIPALAAEGHRVPHDTLLDRTAQRAWAEQVFLTEIEPLLTPIALDPAHPFPRILNKSLNFVIELDGRDAFGRKAGIAVVQAPRALPRVLRVPTEVSGAPHGVMLLTSVVQRLRRPAVPRAGPCAVHQFRVTRNSELFVDDEEITDLREALQGELPQRHYGDAVRLEVPAALPASRCCSACCASSNWPRTTAIGSTAR
jgi:polyphosphate kinase